MKIIDSIVTQAAGIAAIRRDIHAHPELCFEEVRTADLVAQKLTEWGIPIHRGMGTTGVVGIVQSRHGGPAAPWACAPTWTPCPCRSSTPSPMPASTPARCTPAATTVTPPCCWPRRSIPGRNRNFDGTVYLIFQPAEEGGGGAREMIKDGLFDKFDGSGVRHAQLAGHAAGGPALR